MDTPSKTFFQLREDTDFYAANDTILSPSTIRELKGFAKHISTSLQPSPRDVLDCLEIELNKYGYTLGPMDMDLEFEDDSSEDFVIIGTSSKETQKNAYITLSWEQTAPIILDVIPKALHYKMKMIINEISPSEFEDMMDSAMNSDYDLDDYFVGDDIDGENPSYYGEGLEDQAEDIVSKLAMEKFSGSEDKARDYIGSLSEHQFTKLVKDLYLI